MTFAQKMDGAHVLGLGTVHLAFATCLPVGVELLIVGVLLAAGITILYFYLNRRP